MSARSTGTSGAPHERTRGDNVMGRVVWIDKMGAHSHALEHAALIGSGEDADILLSDPAVEAAHARVELRSGEVWVTDLGTVAGTWVNQASVHTAHLKTGTVIRVGASELTYLEEPAGLPAGGVWPESRFHALLGQSKAMRELFALLAKVSSTNATILIRGETGTGKEVVARSIHEASLRAERPFVVVDCASLPENLLDAELFGHSRGAFTGAQNVRIGAIETGDTGTVFLDEIGEVPMSMQPKLLRVLEQRTVRRIGESIHRPVDVRFIFATHRDLRQMVSEGTFREDLYFRIAVLPVMVPPLRERRDDIPLLVEHFLKDAGARPLDAETLALLAARPWRGNVRELRNVVERMVAFGADHIHAMSVAPPSSAPAPLGGAAIGFPVGPYAHPPEIQIDNRPRTPPATPLRHDFPEPSFDSQFKEFREAWVDHGEREYLKRLLARCAGNVPEAAAQAGLHKTYVYRMMRKHRL